MPELPEVESLARALRPRLVRRALQGVTCSFPGVLRVDPSAGADVAGVRVGDVRRRAKLLLIELEDGRVVTVHLRMTGRLLVTRADAPRVKHTHVRFALDRGEELRFVDPRRFGRVEIHSAASLRSNAFFARLGPEPEELDAVTLANALSGRKIAIKTVLLDQRVVAGIGNIYADEILHRVGVHPQLEAGRLRPHELVELVASARQVLSEAIGAGGSTIRDYRSADGRPGGFQAHHRVFGREGQPCFACGTAVRKIAVGGRGTHFCPRCQPRRRRRGSTDSGHVLRYLERARHERNAQR